MTEQSAADSHSLVLFAAITRVCSHLQLVDPQVVFLRKYAARLTQPSHRRTAPAPPRRNAGRSSCGRLTSRVQLVDLPSNWNVPEKCSFTHLCA